MTSLNDVKKLVATLSPDDLKQIKALAEVRLGSEAGGPTQFESFLYGIIDIVHKRRTGTKMMPFNMYLKRGKSAKNFKMHAEHLSDWVSDVIKLNEGRTIVGYKNKLLTLLVELVIDDIERRSLPLKTDIIMNALASGPELFNMAYPGYIQCGLVTKLLTNKAPQ